MSGRDSQSKFQMFALLSGRHVGHVGVSVNLSKTLQQIFEDRESVQT